MLLEDRLHAALNAPRGDDASRDAAIAFSVAFARNLARILTAPELSQAARAELRRLLLERTRLPEEVAEILIEEILAPQNRAALGEDEIRAYEARFGSEASAELRAAAANETDLAAFAARYGETESLLLIDALFRLCAVDGRISSEEIGRLTGAAEQLGVDRMLVGAMFRKYDARHLKGDLTIALSPRRYVIGNAVHLDIPLPDPQIAPRHAEIIHTSDGWRVADLKSGRPTLLNGTPITSAPLLPKDAIKLGSYTLVLGEEGKRLHIIGTRSQSSLSVRNLKRKIGRTTLLDDVSFTVFTGEVIAVVGPSGAGKTTLLNAITGVAPADSGQVLFDGGSFHQELALDRSIVGIVPQDDVVHGDLTVEESLWYAARLRLPRNTSRRTAKAEVERVLDELDIVSIRRSRVGDAVRRGISGGQRKRVNLGQDLLTRSTKVLFLDEPTSGLDPQSAQGIVSLIRQLADDGRIVFLVTHDVSPAILSMIDHLMVLAPGGRLAWFGPPAEVTRYFNVREVFEIFGRLPEKPPEVWGREYRESVASRTYVRTRERLVAMNGERPTDALHVSLLRNLSARFGQVFGWFRQYQTLVLRYARTKRRDRGGMLVIALQAPILGVFMWAVFPAPDPGAMFMLALSSLWFGASGSVRELIADRAIWRREARVGLGTLPYLLSKVTVQGALVALQCGALSAICYFLLPMTGEYGFSLPWLALTTSLVGLIGMALGLAISASLSSSEAAVGTLPLVLIPQITFSGLLVKVKEMGALAKALSYLMIVRYGFEATIKTGERLTEPLVGGQQEREPKPLSGVLYNLGFKTTAEVDDMGIPYPILVLILLGILSSLLSYTLVRTWRSREGN